MKYIYTFKAIALLTALLTAEVHAQEPSYISMDKAIYHAEQNNSHIQQAKIGELVGKAEYRQTDAIFLPQVSLGYTAMATNNPLNAFGFLLQQSRVTAMDFDPAKLNDPGTARNFNAGIDVKLPLLNVDMWYRRKGARIMEDVPKYQTQYTKEYIRYEVQKAYTQLQFAYASAGILAQTLADVKAIRQMVDNFYKQGLIQKSDVLNAEVQVNTVESALTKARSNIANASEGLLLLMGDKPQTGGATLPTDSLRLADNEEAAPTFSPFRSDIMAMQRGLDATNVMVKSLKMAYLPRLNAFGSYQFNDKRIFRFKSDSYMMGLNLSWDIFTGNQTRHKIRAASLQRDRLQLQLQQHIDRSRLEVEKNNRDLTDLAFEIKRHETSVAQAGEALRIMRNRYKEGLVGTTDLLMSQAQFSKTQLEKAQAVMNYNITRYYQQLITAKK